MRKFFSIIFATAVMAAGPALAGPLHGYCDDVGQCVDNGTNSPTTTNPPTGFGFTISSGPTSGDLWLDILVPDTGTQPSAGYAITGTLNGTATLFSSTAWTSGMLDAYLGISASPSNPIGAYLPSAKTLDPSATGFFVYQVDLGSTTLQKPGDPGDSPLETIAPGLDPGTYIIGFLEVQSCKTKKGLTTCTSAYDATANSGAIFEADPPPPPPAVPEPASILLMISAIVAFGLTGRRFLRG